MPDLLLLLPDFALILLGYLICNHTALNRPVWDGVERLVYYLLFPALLFNAIARQPMHWETLTRLGGAGLAISLVGIILAHALRLAPRVDGLMHASGAQCAFRFNSYVALAMAERLAGAPGLAWIAILVSVCVPVVNVAAVMALARHGNQGLLRELARNPLILATTAGLLSNLVGWKPPDLVAITLTRMGSAALPLGLMAVGAGLRLGALRDAPWLAAGLMGIRHVALPLFAVAMVLGLAMPPAQQAVVVSFAALPTASSTYVLATRMGGNGAFVAGLVTISTLLAMLGLPAALGLLAWVR